MKLGIFFSVIGLSSILSSCSYTQIKDASQTTVESTVGVTAIAGYIALEEKLHKDNEERYNRGEISRPEYLSNMNRIDNMLESHSTGNSRK